MIDQSPYLDVWCDGELIFQISDDTSLPTGWMSFFRKNHHDES